MSPTRRVRQRLARPALLAAALVACTACEAPMSIFGAAGEGGRRISALAWFLITAAAIVYVAVMALFIVAMSRNRARDPKAVDLSRPGYGFIIWGGAVMPSIVLAAVFVAGLAAMGRFPARASDRAPAFTITGHQWWWQVDYDDPDLPGRFTTANELHVPVGRPVVIKLNADDVIHSLWVPSLAGKKDLIPGRTSTLQFRADQPGRYRGQCAEFCGFQHAFMAFEVIAEPPDRFDAWVAAQRQPAAAPTDATARRGQQVFLGSACILCHAIEGTTAGARTAPDLTHLGSRTTIAAGTLPNRPGELARWIANPQDFKPGANMPSTTLSSEDMSALVSYLEGLK